MSFTEVISDAIKYPFSDIKKFIIVGVLALLAAFAEVGYAFVGDNTIMFLILLIIGLIFAIILSGYSVGVIRNAIQNSNEIPGVDLVANFIDGIKVLIISIVYYIIPVIIAVILGAFAGLVGVGFNVLDAGMAFTRLIALIIFILFSIFAIVAIARFADTGNLGAALSIGEVIEDAKRVGILNIILFLIVVVIIALILSIIVGIISIIPFIGGIIGAIILGGFMVLFYNRGIGLLYGSA